MLRKYMPSPWLTGVAFLMAVGCSSRGPSSPPSVTALPQQDAQSAGSAKYEVEGGGSIEIYHQGYGVRKAQGVPLGTLRIQLSVRSEGEQSIRLNAGEVHLVDNRGDSLPLGAMKRDGQPTPSVVEVDGGSHAQLDLFFDLPKNYPMDRIQNFRIYWGYQGAGNKVSTETMFVRKDPENMYWIDGRGKKRRYRYFMAVKS